MPPGANSTISTKNRPRYSSQALVKPDSATTKNDEHDRAEDRAEEERARRR